MATSLQLFNKVDLNSAMKARRFYLGDEDSTLEISALKLTACREQDPWWQRGTSHDLQLLAGLESLLCCVSFGELSGLLPSQKKGGVKRSPR